MTRPRTSPGTHAGGPDGPRRDPPDPLGLALLLPAGLVSVVTWSAVLGLGVSRQGHASAVALTATLLVYGPAVAVGAVQPHRNYTRLSVLQVAWALGLLLAMPVYFPGERREAVATGLSLLLGDPEGVGMSRSLAESLPDEPDVAVAQVPQAQPVAEEVLPAAAPIAENEIELPYEGEGRRLSIDVTFEHQGRTVDAHMMLDTGATYTTLPASLLKEVLGVEAGPDAPELVLNTANGQRTAKVVLLDRVWLGSDLPLDGVAITTCEDCASDDNAGLLGLNVTGAYNLHIDADRRMVVFSQRARFNRRLDVRPFSGLQARFVSYPGGRVEVETDFDNRSPRTILGATARVGCSREEGREDADGWTVDLGTVDPFAKVSVRRRLPHHDACKGGYSIILEDAWW